MQPKTITASLWIAIALVLLLAVVTGVATQAVGAWWDGFNATVLH